MNTGHYNFGERVLEIFTNMPLWIVFVIVIIAAVVIWKLIKFALKILLVLIVFFVMLIGLDFLGVFEIIQNILSGFI